MDEAKDLTILITAVCIGIVNVIGAIFAGLAMLSAAKAKTNAELASINAASAARTSQSVRDEVVVVKADLKDVKAQTDGLTKALVKSEKIVSFAAGKEEGIAVQKANGPSDSSGLLANIKAVPEKTATRVVEKIKEID